MRERHRERPRRISDPSPVGASGMPKQTNGATLPRLRLSLTIPGTVALGAYESGAVAALIVAAQELGEDVLVIDSIATAAAGSITGLLAARSLLDGVDAVKLLASAWAEKHPVRALEAESTEPQLLPDALNAVAAALFEPNSHTGVPSTRRQVEPVSLSMVLGELYRQTRQASNSARGGEAQPSMHPYWYTFTLTNTVASQEYLAYAYAAIAAGSNTADAPAAPPKPLVYEQCCGETGLLALPEDGLFWYTIGGTGNNEVLDRTINVAEWIGSDEERLYLVINPDPAFPTRSLRSTFSGDASPATLTRARTHLSDIGHSSLICEQLTRLEETSSELDVIETIEGAVDSGRGEGHRVDIESVASRIIGERESDFSVDYARLLGSLVDPVRGPANRRQVPVEVVSPAVDPRVALSPSQQLVGPFLSHFEAELDFTLHQSDFSLGYRNMSYWLEHRLSGYVPHFDLSTALELVARGYDGIGWIHGRQTDAQIAAPLSSDDVDLGTLALRSGCAVGHDLLLREA
jgi:hypothetical protein